jgi:pimeloyl-ACP methyl ester carboxylesterase
MAATTTFVLVHGAWHGAWCWELVVRELEVRDAHAVALDLPTEDPEADASAYAGLVAAECERHGTDVTLVGHSLAGIVLPRVALRRRVRRQVFVCGAVPLPGHSFAEQFSLESIKAEPDMHATASDDRGLSWWRDTAAAIAGLYHDCPSDLAEWAVSKLRGQARAAPREPFPDGPLPDVHSAYVLCREDRMFSPDWMRSAARDRLGTEPVEIAGGHCPMLSRPDELAELLVRFGAA